MGHLKQTSKPQKLIPRCQFTIQEELGWFPSSGVTAISMVDDLVAGHLAIWTSKFWLSPKQLAKNAKKCAIDSFCKSEDDPTKMDNFHKLLRYRENIYLNYSS